MYQQGNCNISLSKYWDLLALGTPLQEEWLVGISWRCFLHKVGSYNCFIVV